MFPGRPSSGKGESPERSLPILGGIAQGKKSGGDAEAALLSLAHQRIRPERVDLCFRVRFEILGEEESMKVLAGIRPQTASGPLPSDSYTFNISNGGLGLCVPLAALEDELPVEGNLLKLEIHSTRAGVPVRCLGRVAWIEVDSETSILRAGVTFVAVNPTDLKAVQAAEFN
jgi:hypothetical protein